MSMASGAEGGQGGDGGQCAAGESGGASPIDVEPVAEDPAYAYVEDDEDIDGGDDELQAALALSMQDGKEGEGGGDSGANDMDVTGLAESGQQGQEEKAGSAGSGGSGEAGGVLGGAGGAGNTLAAAATSMSVELIAPAEEPPETAGAFTRIQIRLPDGTRVQRRFAPSNECVEIFRFADLQPAMADVRSYVLLSTNAGCPNNGVLDRDRDTAVTLTAADLVPSASLNIRVMKEM